MLDRLPTGPNPLWQQVTFMSFLAADVLVTSESKFSHLAAMLSHNIKFAVAPFQYAEDCDDLWVPHFCMRA